MITHSESNTKKSQAGKQLKIKLSKAFDKLIKQKIILDYQSNVNFTHAGCTYKKQYLINFVIETIDNKFILINNSTSFRHDRFKILAYDIHGVLHNSSISSNIIASIALYPDSEIKANPSFISFREEIKKGKAFSPTSHLFTISEFKEFLENHQAAVESELESYQEAGLIKDGSYYGKAGNALEKEVVKILNTKEYLEQYYNNMCEEKIFTNLLDQLCSIELKKEDIRSISSTNTVQKLAKGGNAKTDVIITITTNDGEKHIKTLSIKKSKAASVSCHDYKYNDFVRVLNIENTKLEEYFKLFQENPTYSRFEQNLPHDFSIKNFENELAPYIEKLTQWVLTGQHDNLNLIDPTTQISEYILIVKNKQIFCSDFMSYIDKMNTKSKKKFGLPFSWTYPSKQEGNRIQLKMPILID